jgi:hypothetical protein
MKVQETSEIRELTAEEMEVPTGAGFLSPFLKAWTRAQAVQIDCEQDPTGHGTTIGNCLIV